MIIQLPWPPSVNRYWRHPNKGRLSGRSLISREGRQYRNLIVHQTRMYQQNKRLECRLAVIIKAYPPDRRKRDLDNLLKAPLDALTHAGVWVDDSQIDCLIIRRMETVSNPGAVTVEVQEI